MSLPVVEKTSLLTESPNVKCPWSLESRMRRVGVCALSLWFILLHRMSSLIARSAYSEAQGCPIQGQQCYRHLLTRLRT